MCSRLDVRASSDSCETDVIFFGENVPRDQVAECFALTETTSLPLVLGSSLTVQSGYQFVRHATGLGVPVAIINQGPTGCDAEATLTLDAPLGPARLRPIAPRRAARPQKMKGISILVDCWYSG